MRFLKLAVGAYLFSVVCGAYCQNWRVTDHWKIGGEGRWDYLLSDDAAHRLYVSHGTRVEVLDTATGKVVGAVTGLKGVHGIALNPDGKTGYISDGAANAIVVFDRDSLTVKQTVAAGTNPDGIAFDPATHTVWAFNGRSKNVSVMDATNNTIVATIALPGKPESPQADGSGEVFANIEDQNTIVKLDAAKRVVAGSWKLDGCESPSGLAIDPAKHHLFSVCDGKKMAISDYAAGKVVALAQIGDGPDAAAFDPQRKLAFSSNGEGSLTIVDAAKNNFPVVETVPTAKGARTMAYDATTGHAFLSAAQYGPTPTPTDATPRPRPAVLPGSFEIIVVSR